MQLHTRRLSSHVVVVSCENDTPIPTKFNSIKSVTLVPSYNQPIHWLIAKKNYIVIIRVVSMAFVLCRPHPDLSRLRRRLLLFYSSNGRVLLLLSKHIAFSWPSSIVAFNASLRACLNLPPPSPQPHPTPHQFQFPMDLNHQKPNAPSYDYDYDFLVRVSRFFLSSAGYNQQLCIPLPSFSLSSTLLCVPSTRDRRQPRSLVYLPPPPPLCSSSGGTGVP